MPNVRSCQVHELAGSRLNPLSSSAKAILRESGPLVVDAAGASFAWGVVWQLGTEEAAGAALSLFPAILLAPGSLLLFVELLNLRRIPWRRFGFHDLVRLGGAVLLSAALLALVVGSLAEAGRLRGFHFDLLLYPALSLLTSGGARVAWRLGWERFEPQRSGDPAPNPNLSLDDLHRSVPIARPLSAGPSGIPAPIIRLTVSPGPMRPVASPIGDSPFGSIQLLPPVEASRLLLRPTYLADFAPLAPTFDGTTILVTGAAGSIGSAICRQLIRFRPSRLVLFDLSENNLCYLGVELNALSHDTTVEFVVGNVQDRRLVDEVLARFQPYVVIHAAARKHVHLMEQFPEEAVRTNLGGTVTLARACQCQAIARFVFISTDKAVRPISIMGATKRAAERFLLGLASEGGPTRYVIVRLGNVLGSEGSVLEIFRRQIAFGYPLTITDLRASRYFVDVTEATYLILRAAVVGESGEIYMPDMGSPIRILDLARNFALSLGLDPETLPIQFIGLRPGERCHEELCNDEERLEPTAEPGILSVKAGNGRALTPPHLLSNILDASAINDRSSVLKLLHRLLPEFRPGLADSSAEGSSHSGDRLGVLLSGGESKRMGGAVEDTSELETAVHPA